jgi:HTH-type transcriptional regulator/antitoxin HigA
MNIKPIKSNADFRLSLQEIEGQMAAAPESTKGEKLDVMSGDID